ncbi:11734_t:CDS:1, partial [Scutellospora calospora]
NIVGIQLNILELGGEKTLANTLCLAKYIYSSYSRLFQSSKE